MLDILDLSKVDLPAGALIGTLTSDYDASTRSELIAQVRERLVQGCAEQKKWRRSFDTVYEQARQSNWSETYFIQWAVALLEKQRAALELFHPLIKQLQHQATSHAVQSDANLVTLYLATIDLMLGWITPYQRLCGQLLELAAERRDNGNRVLRAKPVTGDIDHLALTRKIIDRFPKILAELAK